MASKGMFYGVVVLLVAMLLFSSSVALYYYGQEEASAQQNKVYVGELNAALTDYRSLSGSFNSSLKDYNTTLALLASAVENLNTSTPAYRNASVALSSLWASYQALADTGGRKALTYSVDMLVDYGDGSRHWYNDSTAQPGWNAYVLTLVLLGGNMQADWYPQYGEHFVTGVDGVPSTGSQSWFVWEFSGGSWTPAATGADYLEVHNGTIIAWTLCGYDANFNPACRP